MKHGCGREPLELLVREGKTLILMETLISEAVIEEAFAWLCRQRKGWPDSADVWDFRRHWTTEKASLQRELRNGTYQIGLLSRTTLANGDEVDLWSSRDALVTKALTIVLQPILPVSAHCTHLKGHGGLKGAIRQVPAHVDSHPFVCKTVVQSYYASIDHHRLFVTLTPHVTEPLVRNLVGQYLKRRAERGGLVWEYRQGIPLGCPLSPLLGAVMLAALDEQIAQPGTGPQASGKRERFSGFSHNRDEVSKGSSMIPRYHLED